MSSERSLRVPKRIRFGPVSVVRAVAKHKRLVRADLPLLNLSVALQNWKKRVEK